MRAKYRQRSTSFRQGHLADVGKYFAPLIGHCPDTVSFLDWIENYIFHIHERNIETYVAQKAFRMPGLYYWLPTRPIAGYGRRQVIAGRDIIVRFDSTRPNVIDVETVPGVRDQPRTFRLSRAEWESIFHNLARKQ